MNLYIDFYCYQSNAASAQLLKKLIQEKEANIDGNYKILCGNKNYKNTAVENDNIFDKKC